MIGFFIVLFSIWLCSFLIARGFSLLGGKRRPFAKTYWKNDLGITGAQAFIMTIILVLIS
ncbi:hypothetical protein HXA34_01080 [Salipaludibacillus agaradhaerens]|uniref:hypothetical protein n=1 Tax=Salipaludibacillus agaradhaerens TaxID=76935 RepID=UPI002151A9DC|nr:hypothetical protein [Salipaludibacillus agaradhaerens]MCR6104879.1 hypothetical protein [Salipaludibacillus agaradhaerens]MCR6116926.1 hypothetical protein [Salipaludibacillus agaradhaerens]